MREDSLHPSIICTILLGRSRSPNNDVHLACKQMGRLLAEQRRTSAGDIHRIGGTPDSDSSCSESAAADAPAGGEASPPPHANVPYQRRCRRRPIRCKNCRCPEFPPSTLFPNQTGPYPVRSNARTKMKAKDRELERQQTVAIYACCFSLETIWINCNIIRTISATASTRSHAPDARC